MRGRCVRVVFSVVLPALVLAVVSGLARAASVAYYLDQSNVLPDGIPYVRVTIGDSAAIVGDIDFRIETLQPLNDVTGKNFGIDRFAFNYADPVQSLTSANFTNIAPGWDLQSDKRMDGFGEFGAVIKGHGHSRTDMLTFSISGIDGDAPLSYATLFLNKNAAQGAQLFAVHVGDFGGGITALGGGQQLTSGFIGGSALVPVPAAVWLLGSGLFSIVAFARVSRVRGLRSDEVIRAGDSVGV